MLKIEIFGPNIKPFAFTKPDIYDSEYNKVNFGSHLEVILKFKLAKKVYENDMIRKKIN